MRLRDRWLILVRNVGVELIGRADDHHLTTDPVCIRYRAPKPGSRLERTSRGHSCGRCLVARAFGWLDAAEHGSAPDHMIGAE